MDSCILFRGVHVKPGARIFNSIIMQGAEIGENVHLEHVILDKGVKILPGRTLQGYDSFPIVIRKNQTV